MNRARPPVMTQDIRQLSLANSREKWRRELTAAAFAAPVVLLLCGILLSVRNSPWCLLFFIPSLACALFFLYNLLHKPVNPALKRVIESDDIQAIGVLLEALEICDESEEAELRRALTGLLSRLTSDEAWTLCSQSREYLNGILQMPDFDRHADFLSAILLAYARVGDNQALCIMDWLGAVDAGSVPERKVRSLARDCSAVLKARLEQEHEGKELLRASQLSGPGDLLLRPAGFSQASKSETLLRPVQNPDSLDPDHPGEKAE